MKLKILLIGLQWRKLLDQFFGKRAQSLKRHLGRFEQRLAITPTGIDQLRHDLLYLFSDFPHTRIGMQYARCQHRAERTARFAHIRIRAQSGWVTITGVTHASDKDWLEQPSISVAFEVNIDVDGEPLHIRNTVSAAPCACARNYVSLACP